MKGDEMHYLKLLQFAVEIAVEVDLSVVFLSIIWTRSCKASDSCEQSTPALPECTNCL